MSTRCFLLAAVAFLVNANALPRVVVFATGGTISGRHDPAKGGYVPASTGQELVAAVPKLRELAEIHVEQVTAINSADMTPEVWVDLASRVQRVLVDPSVAAAIV